MTDHDEKHFRHLLDLFGVRDLGDGDAVAGANTLAAMACVLADLAPDDGTLRFRDGSAVRLGVSLLVGGPATAIAMLSLLVLSGCGRPDEFKGRVTVMVSQPEAEAADAVAGDFTVDVEAICGKFTRAYPEKGAEFRLSPAGASIEVEIAVVRPTSHQAEQDAKDAAGRFVEMVDDARKEKAAASLEALKAQIEKQRAKTELSRARMPEMLERSGQLALCSH